jgi:uncharacterized membrane protein
MDSRCIMLVIYKDRASARQMLDRLERMDREETIQLEGATVIDKKWTGRSGWMTRRTSARGGRVRGAITGALVGLLAGPGGAIVGAAAGAVTGGAAASVIDLSMDKDLIERINLELKPGTSALVAVIEDKWTQRLEESMDGEIRAGAAHFYHKINDGAVEQWEQGEGIVTDRVDEDDETV